MSDRQMRRASDLGNPFFLGALALLIINDHYLKAHYHNAVTGKLSDFAGLFVVGFLGVAFARRHQHSERLTLTPIAVIFVAAKTIPLATAVVIGVLNFVLPWSNAVVTDPSDLIALLVLPLVPVALDCRSIRLRIWAKNGLLLTTVAACTATSQFEPNPVHLGVADDGRVVAVREGDLFGPEPDPASATVEVRSVGSLEFMTVPKDLFHNREAKTSDCSTEVGDHCFRLDPSGSIEETLDGGDSWGTIWRVTPDSYASLVGAGLEAANYINPLAPRDLEVTDDADLIVLVGDSTLVTRSVEGVWVNPDSTFRPVTLALLVQLFLASIVFYAAIALGLEMFKPKVLWIWIPLVLLAALSLGFGVLVADPSFPLFELLSLLLTAACGFFALLALRRPKIGAGPALVLTLAAPPLLALFTAGPVGVWKYANFSTFETMATLSALTAMATTILVYSMAKGMDRTVSLTERLATED